ncbi:MAG: radical SAM protein, partial [Endomicrobiaceae bacterium]|nr:radical SAM protein [Endomicrobiaceae bacterium]
KSYMGIKEYDKAQKVLKKIVNDKNIVAMSISLLLKIYAMTNCHSKVLRTYNKIKEVAVPTLEESDFAINSAIMLRKHKLAIKIAEDSKISKEQIYRDIIIYIQNLNKHDKYGKINKIFKDIYKLIPKQQKKFKNILLNEYEIANGIIFLRSKPRIVAVKLTSKCNLKCKMCYQGIDTKERKLSDKHCNELLELMPYMERLILQGGEVFLYNRFDEILQKACDSNVSLEIVTNGLLLNETRIRQLINSNSEITFSIDGFSKKTYESIRIGANFDHLLNNLQFISEYKKNINNNATIRLQMVVMKSNYKEIESAFDFAYRYNFDEVILIPIKSEKNISNDEYIFDVAFDQKIIKFLDNENRKWTKIMNNMGIILKNYLPKIEFYSNVVNKNIKSLFPKNPKSVFDADILKSVQQHKKYHLKKLFCFMPWKAAYFADNSIVPTCFCPCNDDAGSAKSAQTILKDRKTSLINYWNSENMLYYRKAIIMNKYDRVCSQICINEKTSCVIKKNII